MASEGATRGQAHGNRRSAGQKTNSVVQDGPDILCAARYRRIVPQSNPQRMAVFSTQALAWHVTPSMRPAKFRTLTQVVGKGWPTSQLKFSIIFRTFSGAERPLFERTRGNRIPSIASALPIMKAIRTKSTCGGYPTRRAVWRNPKTARRIGPRLFCYSS